MPHAGAGAYQQDVVVPERTINEVINPPTTNTSTSTYTVAGVDPPNTLVRPGHQGPAREGHVASTNPATSAHQVLVTTAYASQKGWTVGQTLTINSASYTIVGTRQPDADR